MARKDIVMATQEELQRLHVIRKSLDQLIKQREAAEILDLSTRQVRRIAKRIRIEGDRGIIHRLRGKPSNRKLPFKSKALKLFEKKYEDFGPTLASEKLFEMDHIKVSDETLRLWLIEEGIAYPERKKRAHRRWRERKAHPGEMIQGDGSHHPWFEARGPECVLMAYIDDATGRPFGRFYTYEGTIPALDSFKRYVKKYGIPKSVYLDRHSTYKSTQKPSLADELKNTKPLTQFARALKELGTDLIYAYSPQAKGRVERLFRTFQDRLIKEMRLRNIRTIERGNKFLRYYLPVYAKRFCIPAAQEENLHRPIPEGLDLNPIFSIKTERTLRNDFTVAYEGKLYQIEDRIQAKKVTVIEKLNGALEIHHQAKRLQFSIITRKSKKEAPKPSRFKLHPKGHSPSPGHPWRKFKIRPHSKQHPESKEKLISQEKPLSLAA